MKLYQLYYFVGWALGFISLAESLMGHDLRSAKNFIIATFFIAAAIYERAAARRDGESNG